MALGEAQPRAAEVARRLQRRHLLARGRYSISIVAPLGVALVVLTELEGVRSFRKAIVAIPLVVLIVVVAQRREVARRLRFPLLLAVLLGLVVASHAWTTDRYGTVHNTIEYVAMASGGWMVGSLLDRATLNRVYATATRIFIVVTAAALLVAHRAAIRPAIDGAPGWHGVFGHKNELGFVMAIGLLALWFERPRRKWWLVWLAAGSVLLLGSESGAGLAVVAIVGAIALWEATVRRAGTRFHRSVLVTSWALVLTGVGLAITDFPAATALVGKKSTLTGRTTIWQAVWHAISARPVSGFGFGGVWLSKGGETAKLWTKIGFQVFEAHNAWLDVLLQLGLVGLVVMVFLVGQALWRGWSAFRYGEQADRWAWLLLVAFLVESSVESILFGAGIFTVAALVSTWEQHPWAWRVAQ